MAHIIILEAIEELSGDPTEGVFNTLKGYVEGAVETIHEIPPKQWSEAQADVMAQADVIANKFENGFTPTEIAAETATLGVLIGEL